MRKLAPFTLAFACSALLAVQALGLHAHRGADGHPAGVHGTHVHGNAAVGGHVQEESAPHGHDHPAAPAARHIHAGESPAAAPGESPDSEFDVSLFDLATAWAKFMPVLLASGFVLLVLFLAPRHPWPAFRPAPLSARRSRWRPPLRAPPSIA